VAANSCAKSLAATSDLQEFQASDKAQWRAVIGDEQCPPIGGIGQVLIYTG